MIFMASITVFPFLAGCGNDQKEVKNTYELLNAGGGLVYRMNKGSGEVTLIVGPEIRKLEEGTGTKPGQPKANYLTEWPAATNSQLGGITLKLRTNWREGNMFYIFEVSPYLGRVQTEHDKGATTEARFILNFYDSDGFQLLRIPVQLSQMEKTVDADGKPTSVSVNTTIACSAATYEAIKIWSAGWAGFGP